MQLLSRLIGRLSFSAKFLLIGLVFLLPVLVLSYQSVVHSYALLKSTDNELAGLRLNTEFRQLIQQLQLHRGLSNTFLSGDVSNEPKIIEVEARLRELSQSLQSKPQESMALFGVSQPMAAWG